MLQIKRNWLGACQAAIPLQARVLRWFYKTAVHPLHTRCGPFHGSGSQVRHASGPALTEYMVHLLYESQFRRSCLLEAVDGPGACMQRAKS